MSAQPSPAFPVALDTEIADTERVILKQVATQLMGPGNPTVARLTALKELREKHYAGLVADVDMALAVIGAGGKENQVIVGKVLERTFTPAQGTVVRHGFLRLPGRKQSPERQRAIAAARHLLLEKTTPVKTYDIYQHLLSRGLSIGGTDPVNNLSAALSHAPGFRSHGKSGWTLETQEATG